MARLRASGRFDLPQEMNVLVLGIIMEAFLGADFVRHMPPTVASDFRDFIRGLAIPAGADVFVAPVLSHRLPVLFENAEQYHPDRYLTQPKQTSYLHGFGGGTHRCLGEHFADLLTHVTVTRLLQHYELTLVSPHPEQVRTPAFKGPRSPCLIRHRVKPRT